MKQLLMILCAITATTSFAQPKRIEYRHDLRIGTGLATDVKHMQNSGNGFGYSPNYYAYYGYRIIKGLKVTGTISYYQYKEYPLAKYYANPDEMPDYTYHKSHLRLSPAVQYEWFNRGIVTMYSDIGLTIDITSREYKEDGIIVDDRQLTHVRPNVTPFGITVGKKLFGFAELFSFGPRGLFNVGVGYRF